jgi:hypothetical protein
VQLLYHNVRKTQKARYAFFKFSESAVPLIGEIDEAVAVAVDPVEAVFILAHVTPA